MLRSLSCCFLGKGGKADERIKGAMSYFRKAIAIDRAVGAGPFARHHGSRLSFFPSWFTNLRCIVRCLKRGRRLIFIADVEPANSEHEANCSWFLHVEI